MRRPKRKNRPPEDWLRELARNRNLAPSGYVVATNDPMQVNQVVVLAELRYVVRQELTAEEFRRRTAENALRRAEQSREFGLGPVPGRLQLTVEGAKATDVQEASGPPADAKFFYALQRLD